MRAVIQRVNRASVAVGERICGAIGRGLLILLGIEQEDEEVDVNWLAARIARLRIFGDNEGVMNLSLTDTDGAVLVVSQFTLHASLKKGNRPYYGKAALPEKAVRLYASFLRAMERETGKPAAAGEFGAHMRVALENDGPVTIIADSKNIE